MTLAEKIAFILSGRTVAFARGGGARSARKGKAGGKSSKKGKGVTQAGKGGACCKTEGGKFAKGNNYGSLAGKGTSAKVAANSARRVADKAARQAGVRVEATRRGASPVSALVARSKLAASKAGVAKAERDKAKAVQDKKDARNARARETRAEKKAARPARDKAIGSMVAKSKAAAEAKSASRKAPTTASNVADRVAAAKAKQKADVLKTMAGRAVNAPSGVKTPTKPAPKPIEREAGEREARWRASGIQAQRVGGKGLQAGGVEKAATKADAGRSAASARPDKAALERDLTSKDPAVRRKAMDGILERQRQKDASAKERRGQREIDRDVRAAGKKAQEARDELDRARMQDPNARAGGVVAILERDKAAAGAKVAALKAKKAESDARLAALRRKQADTEAAPSARAAAIKRATDASRVASGKAGAKNAARYRTKGIGGREPDLKGAPPARELASTRYLAGRDDARARMVRASREAAQGARMVATKRAKAAAKVAAIKREAAIKRAIDRSRVASGKAGAKNAARKRRGGR